MAMGAQGRNGYQGREADRSAQCVWMQGGLVSYKLCDRRLDCEHCPFDAALRAGSPPAAGDSTFLAGAGPAQLHVRPAGESKAGLMTS